jgi:hypothetical protein
VHSGQCSYCAHHATETKFGFAPESSLWFAEVGPFISLGIVTALVVSKAKRISHKCTPRRPSAYFAEAEPRTTLIAVGILTANSSGTSCFKRAGASPSACVLMAHVSTGFPQNSIRKAQPSSNSRTGVLSLLSLNSHLRSNRLDS